MDHGILKRISIRSSKRVEFIDLTRRIEEELKDAGVKKGFCVVYVPHTTAGITINENADPDVVRDIIARLDAIAPESSDYYHTEGNAPAHVKASIVGSSVYLIVEDGRPLLGRWQGVFFCEFDGPRNREVYIKIMGS